MRTSSLAVTLGLAIVVFSGCLGGGSGADDGGDEPSGGALPILSELDGRLSQPLYDEVVVEHEPVAASQDGKLLDSWVFRPKTPANVTVPVFINFSPYWANLAPTAASGGDAFSQYMIQYFVPRGYAVVLSSARGTGFSEGCFNMGGDIEKQDAYDVVEHFAAKEWSNGNVGAGGKSYDGTIPNGVLVTAPPSLRTIFPVSGISELYKYNYKGGLPYQQGIIFNTYYYALVGVANADAADPVKTGALVVDDLACTTLPENQAHGFGSGATGDYTEYWIERNYSAEAAGVGTNVSVFFVHGLQDWNVKPDHITPFLPELKKQGVPVKAWLHQWVEGGTGHVYPMRQDWNLTMLKWLDHWLKDKQTGIMDEPLVQVQDDQGTWRHEDVWPPEHAVPTRFYPGADGLSADAADATGSVEYTDSATPLDPQAPTEVRRATDPLAEDLRIAGEPWMNVRVASDQARGHVIVEVYRIAEDGTWDQITWGGLNLRHRQALEDPQPVVPDTTYDISFPLHPVDAVIPAGSALGIRIAADGGGYFTQPSGATYTIDLGAKSYLEVPRIDNVITPESPQPTEIVCFAC